MYNINPKGTFTYKGVTVPTILCHQDAYKLGLGSNHGDVYHWFNKHGKTMDDVRNDVATLLNGGGSTTKTEIKSIDITYQTWDDVKKQALERYEYLIKHNQNKLKKLEAIQNAMKENEK